LGLSTSLRPQHPPAPSPRELRSPPSSFPHMLSSSVFILTNSTELRSHLRIFLLRFIFSTFVPPLLYRIPFSTFRALSTSRFSNSLSRSFSTENHSSNSDPLRDTPAIAMHICYICLETLQPFTFEARGFVTPSENMCPGDNLHECIECLRTSTGKRGLSAQTRASDW